MKLVGGIEVLVLSGVYTGGTCTLAGELLYPGRFEELTPAGKCRWMSIDKRLHRKAPEIQSSLFENLSFELE